MRLLRPAGARLAAILILLVLGVPPVAGAPLSDDYLRGYAVAVLEREFGVRAGSLTINDGVLQISEADLGTADRSAVVAALARIEGVKQVVIVGASATPLPPAPGAGTSSRAEAPSALRPGFLPAGLLFAPLLADPMWPRFAASLRYYIDEDDLSDIGAVSMGESIPFYRWRGPEKHLWEVGVQTVVLSLFDLNTSSADLLTTDYFVAGFLGWRSGEFSGLFRLFHQSAHIGDELVERGISRRDFSAEGIDVKLSADLPAGFRVYGGVGYLVRRDPESLDPWYAQAGLEFRSHWRAWQVIRPIAALDIQSREENDWTPALSIRAGVQFDSVQVFGRSLQLLGEYYIGDALEGQFNGRDVQYVGAGIYFSF
jgi:Protein of unknown function (DUF1207)